MPLVQLTMTHEETVRAAHEHFGCGYVTKYDKSHIPNRSDAWCWRVTYQKARDVVNRVRPYLLTKAEDADKLLAFEKKKGGTPRGYTYTKRDLPIGVYKRDDERGYVSYIGWRGKSVYVGYFYSVEVAVAARAAKKKELEEAG